jgi:hypothetical protein
MTTDSIIAAINAYADAQKRETDDRSWLALTHRSSRGSEADAARTLRDAGSDALESLLHWRTVEKREEGACLLESPDGDRVVYYCERMNGRTFERVERVCNPTGHDGGTRHDNVSERQDDASPDRHTRMVIITGNTYPVKDQLKGLGGTWIPTLKGWRVPAEVEAHARQLVRDAVSHSKPRGDYIPS